VASTPTSSTTSASERDEPSQPGEPASERDAERAPESGEGDNGVESVPEPEVDAPDLVNSRRPGASNRAERQREAEEDRVLVERAQQGDREAFRQLVQRHQRRAFAIAVGLVRDENDAREIVQEAFLRVFKSLKRFKGGSSFFTWLYRIVTNLAIDHMRKPARRETELFDNPQIADDADAFPFMSRVDGGNPSEAIRRREIAERIQQALDALPPYHRAVIIMREVEGMSYQQMAEAMEVSKGTIMSRLFHARQKLQRALSDCYGEHIGAPPCHKGKT